MSNDQTALQNDIDTFSMQCMHDFEFFSNTCLKIKPKTGGIVPFEFNKAQKYLDKIVNDMIEKYGKVRVIIVKGRQQGLSTWVEARGYWKVSHTPGTKAFILTHEGEATKNLFNMAKRYHDNAPVDIRPIVQKSNQTEMVFPEMECEYAIGTAKTGDSGRSQTIQFFHGCLAQGTQILTPERRVKAIEDFDVGDFIVTHTGKYAQISFISENIKQCYSVKLKGHYLPVVSSGEHKFVTENGKMKLDDLQVGDKVLMPIPELQSGEYKLAFALPDRVRCQGGGVKTHMPESIQTTYGLGKVLGLYLAEGTIKYQRAGYGPCAVVFTVHEDEVSRTLDWLKILESFCTSTTVQTRADSKSVNVVMYGRDIAEFVLTICGKKDSKNLANPIFKNKLIAQGAIHGYLAGDGHFETATRRVSAPSIREAITYGMRDLLAALGYGWASIAFKPAAMRYGRNERDCWSLRLTGSGVDLLADEMGEETAPRKRKGAYGQIEVRDGYAYVPITDIEHVGNQPVYDFEVNHDDHSYCLPQCSVSNSEVAYWRAAKEIASGCMEGIPEEPGTESYLESTAAGFGGYFHSMWQNGIYPGEEPHAKWNGYIRVFVPWIWQPEYRMEVFGTFERTEEEENISKLHNLDDEQLQWRRMKIAKMENDTARFQRDYPLTPEEAFNSAQDNVLISADLVIKARAKGELDYYQPVGSVILGVDVARFGDDSTSFALRQGRVIFWTKRFNKLDSMAVTSEVIRILRQFKIDFVTIDGTGGYGAGVIDRLREMGYGSKVVEVNFSERALEEEKFKNKRSEIWAATRDWLIAGAQLPNEDAIQHDLCSVTYKFDSAGDKLQLESKAEMKKRGIKSPDIGDAIALTFARPSLGLAGVNGKGESFDPDEYFG